jgi:hypothetical protein
MWRIMLNKILYVLYVIVVMYYDIFNRQTQENSSAGKLFVREI